MSTSAVVAGSPSPRVFVVAPTALAIGIVLLVAVIVGGYLHVANVNGEDVAARKEVLRVAGDLLNDRTTGRFPKTVSSLLASSLSATSTYEHDDRFAVLVENRGNVYAYSTSRDERHFALLDTRALPALFGPFASNPIAPLSYATVANGEAVNSGLSCYQHGCSHIGVAEWGVFGY